jgi:L-seryl-tRNA(Ser) seleniumtransferase
MGYYDDLGVKRVINADATLTRLGGTRMPRPVLEAMVEAAGAFVDMHDLQLKVGRRIAELTQNEAAFVCTGASAGLFLSTLACMTRGDLRAIAHLPSLEGLRNEVVVHRSQRNPYDPAILLAGARLVEVGNIVQTFEWELEAALNERTAAVFFFAGGHLSAGALPLETVIALAHARDIPVVVDAAAQLPPRDNLWRLTQMGADLVVFSGGKGLRGPQASGLIVGRSDLIEAVRQNAAPHQRLGRPMKVGKEEMIGLLAAVEWYLAQDQEALSQRYETVVRLFIERFGHLPGMRAERSFPSEAGQPIPRALLRWDAARLGVSAAEAKTQLHLGDPGIEVAFAPPDGIYINPETLEPGEEEIVAERLAAILSPVAAAR